jgi:hypothetical protein
MSDLTAGQRAALAVEDGGTRADAELHGVPYPSVKLARVVLARSPETFAELRAGRIGVTKAHKLACGRPTMPDEAAPSVGEVATLARLSVPELVAWGKRAIEQAGSFHDVKHIRATAAAILHYQRAVEAGIEAVNAAAEIKLRAERRAGQELTRIEKNTGAKGVGKSALTDGKDTPARLDELGISYKQSSDWQKLAQGPDETFEQVLDEVAKEGRVTGAAVTRALDAALAHGMPADKPRRSPDPVDPEAQRRFRLDAALGGRIEDFLKLARENDPTDLAGLVDPLLRRRTLADAAELHGWLGALIASLEMARDQAA